MAKLRYLRTGDAETDLTFRTNEYPINVELNGRLQDEIASIVDTDRCSLQCLFGEVKIRHLTFDYAAMLRLLLQNKRVLGGRYTLTERT